MIKGKFNLKKFSIPHWKKFLNIGVLIFFGFYLYSNNHLFEVLKNLTAFDVILLCSINFIGFNVIALISYLIFKTQNVTIKEFLPLQFATIFLNMFLPKGGTVFRACYLKEKYNVSFSAFSSTFLSTTIAMMIACAALLISAIPFSLTSSLHSIIPILVTIIALFSGIFFLKLIKKLLPQRLQNITEKFLIGWEVFHQHKLIFISVTSLIAVNLLLSTTRFYTTFLSLEIPDIHIVETIIMATVTQLSMLFTITPSGIGTREGLLVLTSSQVLSADLLILTSLILHATSYITTTIIGLPSYIYLTRIKRKTKPASIDAS